MISASFKLEKEEITKEYEELRKRNNCYEIALKDDNKRI
jgi:hypothetical protein